MKIKEWLYTQFKSFFYQQIYGERAEKINELEKILHEQARAHKVMLAEEYEKGVKQARIEAEFRMEKLVADKYTADHWLVNPNEVLLTTESGISYLNREPLTKEEVAQLKEEAKYLELTRLWQIIQNTLRQKAIEKSVLQSTNWEQVLSGKLMIHNLNIIKEIVARAKKG